MSASASLSNEKLERLLCLNSSLFVFFSVFVYFHWCTVYTVYCAALYIETISGHCLFPCINSLICTLWLTKGWRLKDRGLTQQKFWQQEHESGQDVILINHLLFDDPNCLYCIKRLGNILLRIYCEYFRPQDRIKHLFNCEKKKHLCHLDKYRRSQFRAGDIYGPHISEDKVGLSLNSPNTILSPLYLTLDQTFHLEE